MQSDEAEPTFNRAAGPSPGGPHVAAEADVVAGLGWSVAEEQPDKDGGPGSARVAAEPAAMTDQVAGPKVNVLNAGAAADPVMLRGGGAGAVLGPERAALH